MKLVGAVAVGYMIPRLNYALIVCRPGDLSCTNLSHRLNCSSGEIMNGALQVG